MVEERPVRVERRLSAILAADVAGYSRLMHHDEEATHAKLKTPLAEDVTTAISEHGGRIVKNAGDGFLAEFPSAVGAVRAAVQFQVRIKKIQTADAEDKRIAFRVGINVGYPGMTRILEGTAPSILNKSFKIVADVTIPDAGAEGVLATQGGRFKRMGLVRARWKIGFPLQHRGRLSLHGRWTRPAFARQAHHPYRLQV